MCNKEERRGGLAQRLAYKLPIPAAPGLILGVPKTWTIICSFMMLLKFIDSALLRGRGQSLIVDQTHPVLVRPVDKKEEKMTPKTN